MPRLIIKKGDFVINNLSIPDDVLAFTVGSEQGNDVIIENDNISYYHIQFEKQGNDYYVRDLQSQTGTFVNGSKISGRKSLANNDKVKIGDHQITFQLTAADHDSSLLMDRYAAGHKPSSPNLDDKIAGVPSLNQLNSWLNEEHEEKDIFLDDGDNGNSQSGDFFGDVPGPPPDVFDDEHDNEIGPLTQFITSGGDEAEKTALAIETENFLQPEKTEAHELEVTDTNFGVAPEEKKDQDTTLHYYLLGIYGYYLGRKFQLKQSRTRIGREKRRNHIRLTKSSRRRREYGVSRRHVTITFKGNKYYLQDKKSKSGTWVNQKRVKPGDKIQLGPGDEIEIASDKRSHIFRFVMQGDWDFSRPTKTGTWHIRYRRFLNILGSALVVLAAIVLFLKANHMKNIVLERPEPLSATETFWATGSIEPDFINAKLPSFASFPAIADFNGDDLMDVVFVDRQGMLRCIDSATKASLWINPKVEAEFDSPITLADINQDQTTDVILKTKDPRIRVLDGRNGRPILTSPILAGLVTGAPIVADFNGDGLQDLAVSSDTNKIYIGFSGVQKSNWTIIETGESINSFGSAVDLTANGIANILLGTENGQVIIVDGTIPKIIARIDVREELSKATGKFLENAQIRFPVALADLNGDKTVDLIVSTVQGNIVTLSGKSFERFWWDEADSAMQVDEPVQQAISLGDFDGDGLADVANLTRGGRLRVTLGKNIGKDRKLVLWEYPTGKPGEYLGPPAMADFNKDGIMDIVVADRRGRISIFEGSTGQILWESGKDESAIISPPLIGHLDDDDYLDILVYRADGNFYKVSTNSRAFEKAIFWGQTFGNSRHTNLSTLRKQNVVNYSMFMGLSVLMILGTFSLNIFWKIRRKNLSKNHGLI